MGYSEICFRMVRGQKLGGETAEGELLQWSLYALSIYVQILNVNCWLANSTWHMSNTTICIQPWSVNGFSRMFIFQTKLGVMRLQEDGGARSKQIWTILSQWNIGGSSFRCQRSYIFYNANDQLVKRDKVTAVIYYYTTTEFHYAKRDSPLSEYGGVNIEVSYF